MSDSEAVLRDVLLLGVVSLAIVKTRDLSPKPDNESSLDRVEVVVPKVGLIALKVAAVVLLVFLARDLLLWFF